MSLKSPKLSITLDSRWLQLEPLRVGAVPRGLGTAARHVTLEDAESRPLLRVDVYCADSEYFLSEDAQMWRENLMIGFGHRVHAVEIASRSVTTIELGCYFCDFYPTDDYLLIASAERVFRMDPDRSLLWRSECLAVDGVIVHDAGPPLVRGDGECDPPGGWEPFSLDVANGAVSWPGGRPWLLP